MKIAIAGGHGTIALHLTRLLSDAGHEVASIVRNPDHGADVTDAGGRMVLADLEDVTPDELADTIGAADIAVFAAGAGPGSGAERKDTVDHWAAVKLLDAARRLDVDHYVIVSSMGADPTHVGDEVFDAYLVAKGRADDAVRSSGLPFTILRPTSLTDDDPVGSVTLGESADGGPVTRADVAAVIAAIIESPGPGGRTLELTAGDTPIDDAVASAVVGKRVLVTGASSGIGAATARAVVGAGGSVALLARSADALRELADEFGGLDGVVNAAGVARPGGIDRTGPDDWKLMFDVNVLGLLNVTHAALPLLRENEVSDIVNISSMSGRRRASVAMTVYSASKFAVHVISDGLREELAPAGVRVTVIAPGYVQTPIFDDIDDEKLRTRYQDALASAGLDATAVAGQVVHALDQPAGVNLVEIAMLSTSQ